MKMRKLNVPWPRLLIVTNTNGKMAVAALKGNRRPTARTKLYHAPLMNVSSNGAVCTGSASVPLECGVEDIASWESVMFDTAFSHVNNPATFRLDRKKEITTKLNLRFWQSLSKQKVESFPNDRLLPMRNSLENFIGGFSA
jgi:PRTRC genetic system protein B